VNTLKMKRLLLISLFLVCFINAVIATEETVEENSETQFENQIEKNEVEENEVGENSNEAASK